MGYFQKCEASEIWLAWEMVHCSNLTVFCTFHWNLGWWSRRFYSVFYEMMRVSLQSLMTWKQLKFQQGLTPDQKWNGMETDIAFNVEHVMWVISGPGETTSSTMSKSCPENSRKRAKRVPGWPGQGQKASRQECHRVCTGGETGKLENQSGSAQFGIWLMLLLQGVLFFYAVIWDYHNPM